MLEHAKVCRSIEYDLFKKPLTPKKVLGEPEKLPDASEPHDDLNYSIQSEVFDTNVEHEKMPNASEQHDDSYMIRSEVFDSSVESEKLPDASEHCDGSNLIPPEVFDSNVESEKENACDISAASLFLPTKTMDGDAARNSSQTDTNTSTPFKKRKRIPTIGSKPHSISKWLHEISKITISSDRN